MQMGLHERMHRTVSASGTAPGRSPTGTSDAPAQRFKTELNFQHRNIEGRLR